MTRISATSASKVPIPTSPNGIISKATDICNSLGQQNYEKLIDLLDHFYVITCHYPFSEKVDRVKLDFELAQSIFKQMEHPFA